MNGASYDERQMHHMMEEDNSAVDDALISSLAAMENTTAALAEVPWENLHEQAKNISRSSELVHDLLREGVEECEWLHRDDTARAFTMIA